MVYTKQDIKTLMNQLQNDPNNKYDFDYYNGEQDPFTWRTIIEGSEGTIYENGYYMLKIKFSENYPNSFPSVQFMNKIFHPHVSSSGSACIHPESHDILSVLECVEEMFFYYDADLGSAYDQEPRKTLEKDIKENKNDFIRIAKEWVNQYAKMEDLEQFY